MDALGTFRCLVRCAAPSHTPCGNQRQWGAPAIAQRQIRTVAPLRDAAPMEQSNRAGCALIVECPHCTALGCSTALGCTGLHWVGCATRRTCSSMTRVVQCACSMTRVMKHSAWHVRCNVRPCGGRRTYSSNIISLTFTLSSSISLTTMALCLCASSVRLKASRRCYHPLHLQQDLQRQTVLLNHISRSCIGMRLAFCFARAMRRCNGSDHSKLSPLFAPYAVAAGHQLPTLAQHFELHAIEPRCVTKPSVSQCPSHRIACDLFNAHVLRVHRMACLRHTR